MSAERKVELEQAMRGTDTNIEIAKYFGAVMADNNDTVGVSNADQDAACLQRYRDLDLLLAEKEETETEVIHPNSEGPEGES